MLNYLETSYNYLPRFHSLVRYSHFSDCPHGCPHHMTSLLWEVCVCNIYIYIYIKLNIFLTTYPAAY